MVQISYVRQKEAKGLGHAVLMAKDLVGDEPFAVILPDDVIDAAVPCLKQMIDVFERCRARFWRRRWWRGQRFQRMACWTVAAGANPG